MQQTFLYSPAPAVLFLTVIYHSDNNSAPLLFQGQCAPRVPRKSWHPGEVQFPSCLHPHSPLRKLHAAKLTMGMGWQHKVSSSCTVLIGATAHSSLFPLAFPPSQDSRFHFTHRQHTHTQQGISLPNPVDVWKKIKPPFFLYFFFNKKQPVPPKRCS